jgi:hypothetical protein
VGTNLLVFGMFMGVECMIFGYSIRTNSWIQTAPMNYPRALFGSTSVGQQAYLAGGVDRRGIVLSSVEVYDSETKGWGSLPNMNRARKMCSGVFMDGKLFVIGGKDSKNEELTCGEEYDFEQGSWRLIENMCEGLTIQWNNGAPPLVAVVKDELYAADYSEENVKKYDRENNRWITLGKLPDVNISSMNGWGVGFKACGDQLIVIAGSRSSDRMLKLNAWVPDERPPVWNLIARRRLGNFVYNSAVMSC